MTLFQPAETTSAFLKMGLLGFAGSGKTKTASITAIGLVQYMRERNIDYASKPVFFIDTETGSDWVKPDFERAGIKLYTAKTRAFSDLMQAVPEAQANGSLLLIDSITHFWKELCDTYSRRKAAEYKKSTYRLQFQDWGFLKGEWGKFTDAFINSPLHVILCGRAGYEYDYFEGDDGKKELEKTGIKMKAEAEMGYEPSLLVLMDRHQSIEGGTVAKTWREATVLKDRSTMLDGQVFVDPTFKSFLPHIALLNLGGKQLGVDTTRTSDAMIPADKRDYLPVQREICIEEIQNLLMLHYPSTGAEDKKKKLKAVLKHFDATWTEIEKVMPLRDLRAGYDSLYRELEGKPSRYAAALAPEKPTEINDELSEHSAPPAKTLLDKLREQLAACKSTNDCTSWAAAVFQMDVSLEDRLKLSNEWHARVQEIASAEDPLEIPAALRRKTNGEFVNPLAAG
jgi:hypothetical protein